MRKFNIKTFLAGFLLIIAPLITLSQWEMAAGLDGGKTTGMVSVNSFLFAACKDKGVYIKNDTGSWKIAYDNTPYDKVAAAGNCVFIYNSIYGSFCKRSFDYGVSWEPVYNLHNAFDICTLDTVIFFYTEAQLKRSYDFGTTYDTIELPNQIGIPKVLCDDSLMYVHVWDGYDTHKIFYSNDYGNHWDSLNTSGLFPEPAAVVCEIKYLNDSWWAQTESLSAPYTYKGIFSYNSNTSEWHEVTNDLPSFRIFSGLFGYKDDVLCSFESHPVCKFNYADSSWIEFTDDSKSVNQFLTHHDELFCATDQGPCSLDTNGNWTSIYTDLHYRDISSIDTYNGNIYVTANNELFFSTDGGSNFTRTDHGYGSQIITTDTVFYMVSPNDFKMSWDEGNTWHVFNDGIENQYYQMLTHLSITPNYYFISTFRGLYRSPTDSIIWTRLENGPFIPGMRIDNVEAIDNTVIAGANWPPHDLYFSNNYGNSFIEFGEFCEFKKIGLAYYLLKDSIFYSDDLALSWKYILFNSDYYIYCIDRRGDTIVLGGMDNSGDTFIEISYDMGIHWENINDDLPALPYTLSLIKEIKSIDTRLFVGNPKNGLWYRDDILLSIHEKTSSVKPDNILINVFPNPSSSHTRIEYIILNPSKVLLSIYNQLGERIDVNYQYQSAGKHQVLWEAHGSPSGIYYFTIHANNQTGSGKFIVIK